jgi:transposase
MNLTINERTEVLGLYVGGNTLRDVADIFNQRHPNRPRPLTFPTVSKIYRKFRETGSVHNRHRTGRPSKVNNQVIVNNVLNQVNVNPNISTRALAVATNISRNTAMDILHNQGYKPYKVQLHQKLNPRNNERRMQYCNDMIEILDDRPWMLDYILWTDEALFRKTQPFNRQNTR